MTISIKKKQEKNFFKKVLFIYYLVKFQNKKDEKD